MGYVFEELIRKFNEANNENPGEHFTPREIIRLMVDLMFVTEDEKLKQSNIISSIYDPCCGTGGMLTIAKERILEKNPTADVHLFGQELNQKTYAVTKSDMLMLNPDGVDAARIQQGSSLSKDAFQNEKFHYLIANPPYGKNWDMDKKDVTAEHAEGERGRFAPGLTAFIRWSDAIHAEPTIQDAPSIQGRKPCCNRYEWLTTFHRRRKRWRVRNSPIHLRK